MTSTERRAAIVGVHEYPLRFAPGRSEYEIKATSALAALAQAGLSLADVDGLFDSAETGVLAGYAFPEYLGVQPRTVDMIDVGGSSFEILVRHAQQMIATGAVNVAIITYGSTARSAGAAWGVSGGTRGGGEAPTVQRNMEASWGLNTVANYAMVARRHMYQYGTTSEQLAEIAVTSRYHALRNPDAVAGLEAIGVKVREITVDDVVSGPIVADPLHRLDCCLVTDGGGAVVIAGEDVVRDTATVPAWVLGSGEAIGYASNDGDITRSAAVQSGRAAFAEAGVQPDEVDVAMLYDSFTITVLTVLEDLGFCAKGDGGEFVAGGRLRFDTPGLAVNTDGGGLSSNHPGRRGLFLLIEAVRQLRGESTAQVEGARLAVAHGSGGMLATRHSAGTVILGRD